MANLAFEAVALLKTSREKRAHEKDFTPLRVLHIGQAGALELGFFSDQGFKVDQVEPQFAKTPVNFEGGHYHLVYSTELHNITERDRPELIEQIKQATIPGGLNALSGWADLNQMTGIELKGSVGGPELLQAFQGWSIRDFHFGEARLNSNVSQGHYVSMILAECPPSSAPFNAKSRNQWQKPLVLTTLFSLINVVMATFGYSEHHLFAWIWVGAIFQGAASAILGGWSMVAAVVAGVLINYAHIGWHHSLWSFAPANAIQAGIPAYYYYLMRKSGGWQLENFKYLSYAAFGVVAPNLVGGVLGAGAIVLFDQGAFWPAYLNWLWANIPAALIFGWFLFKTLVPEFVRQGWTIRGFWQ